MGRDTTAMRRFTSMYRGLGLNQADTFHKSKLLLSVYRDVVWATICKADELRRETDSLYGHELGSALAYLAEFAPTQERERFEDRLTFLFETKWMIELIDSAMAKVLAYHKNGRVYFEILSKSYLEAYRYSETEILELLALSRTSYYELRREAVTLLGIALWGYALPKMRGVFTESEPSGFFRADSLRT
jgi:hypothetical protein